MTQEQIINLLEERFVNAHIYYDKLKTNPKKELLEKEIIPVNIMMVLTEIYAEIKNIRLDVACHHLLKLYRKEKK